MDLSLTSFFRGNQVAGSRHGFADNSIDAARQLCLKRALLVRIDPEENQRLEDDFPIGGPTYFEGASCSVQGSVTQDSCFGCCCCVHVNDAMQGGPQPIYKWSYKL